MATYYVNAATGTGGGDGSAGDPWDSLTTALDIGSFSTGDIINCTGNATGPSRGSAIASADYTGLTIQQVPGATTYEQQGTTLLAAIGWTNVAGNRYKRTLASGLLIRGVMWDYGHNVTANGSRYGFLTLVANAAACTTTGTYYYDSSGADASDGAAVAGKLTINGGADPLTHDVEYGVRSADNVGVLSFGNMTSCTVTGITISCGLMNSGEGQYGNLIKANTCTDTTWSNLKLYDGGNHMTLMSGGNLSGNLVTGCSYYGCADNGIPHVFYSAAGSSGANEMTDCTMVLHGYLNIDGTAHAVALSGTIGTIYSHTGGGGAKIENLTYRRITMTFILGTFGAIPAADNNTDPTTPENWTTWSCKAIDCVVRGNDHSQQGDSGMAHVNCDYDWSVLYGGASMLLTNGYHGFFGCLLTMNNSGTGIGVGFNAVANMSYFIGCTVINRTSNTGAEYLFNHTFSNVNNTLVIKGCLLAYSRATSGGAKNLYIENNAGTGVETFTTANNAHYGCDSTTGDATITTIATNPFTAIASSGELTAVARRIKHTGANPLGALQGRNHRRWIKNYGAFQYPPAGARGRGRNQRGRML